MHLPAVLCFLTLLVQSCLISAQSSSSSSTGPNNPSSGQPAVITKITGCTNQPNGTTINCSRSPQLTVQGSGFMTGLEDQRYPTTYIVFTLGSDQSVYCQTQYDSPFNDTYLECTLYNVKFRQFPAGQIIPVTYFNLLNNYNSPRFYGVSFAEQQPPVLDRVVGCASTSPDGKSAYNCNVQTDLVTLVGSNFLSVKSDWMKVMLNDESAYISPDFANDLLINFSDTMIVLSFADSYQLVSEIDDADEKPIPFTITSMDSPPSWSLGSMYLQFAKFPSPTITNMTVEPTGTASNCELDMSTGSVRFRKCVPGASQIRITGQYLYKGVVVRVGGQVARLSQWVSSMRGLTVVMPVFEFSEEQFYDITVTTLAGSVTWPGVAQFIGTPVITSVGACIDTGYDFSSLNVFFGQCLPGEKLTVFVLNVKNPSNPRVTLSSLWNSSMSTECSNAVMLDRRTVQCTMGPPPREGEWGYSNLAVQFTSGETTNTIQLQQPFATPNSPRLTSVTGCYSSSNDPMRLNQCLATPTTDVVLTLRGERLRNTFGANWSVSINWVVECARPIVLDDQTLTCLLPDIDGTTLELDTPYPLSVNDWAHQLSSNAAYITFVRTESRDANSSSSSNTTTIVLATIFSVVGAILLIAGALIVYHRMCKGHKRDVSEHSETFGGSRNRHVELSEVSEN